jgi:hypothetical protein
MNCDFFSDLFHIQSDLAGITHGVFCYTKGYHTWDFGIQQKKHSKDTTFTDFSLCYYNKDRFSPLYYYDGIKEGKGIVPGNEELDNIMVKRRSR